MDPIFLSGLSPAETRGLLERGAPVYLSVNPTEYHGPHLSLENDHLVSMGLARDLHARVGQKRGWPFLVADRIFGGVDPCPGPGTVKTSFSDLVRQVEDACKKLADLGARRVVLMTFHGAPLHAIALDAGVRLLEARGIQAYQPLVLLMEAQLAVNAAEFEDAFECIEDPLAREQAMRDLQLDFHAGFFETSMALHYAPETVSALHRSLPPCPAYPPHAGVTRLSNWARSAGRERFSQELELVAIAIGWYGLRPFPGYTGRPDLARPEAGEIFARYIVERYAERAELVFRGGLSPRPVLRWLVPLTLGGRIQGLHVPLDDVQRFADAN